MPNLNTTTLTVGGKPPLLRCLFYGDSGSGKTTLAGSFPKPFIFDFDHKLKVLAGKDIEFESFNADSKESAKDEQERFRRLLTEVKKSPKYDTLVIDGITLLSAFSLQWAMKATGKVLERPTLEAYGIQYDFFQWFFMEINSPTINKNIVCLAHANAVTNDDGGIEAIQPLISGKKMPAMLPAYFEETYYLQATQASAGTSYKAYYRPKGKAIANTQILKGGPGFIENPTYQKIVEAAVKGIVA